MLTGSGEPEEDEQALWLEPVMAEAGERRIAWFLHRPLFLRIRAKAIPVIGRSSRSRAGTSGAGAAHRVALVASGHLPSARFRLRGHSVVWSPASSFLIGAPQPEMPGEKRLGAVVYELDNATLAARIAEVPGLAQHWWPRPANVSARHNSSISIMPAGRRKCDQRWPRLVSLFRIPDSWQLYRLGVAPVRSRQRSPATYPRPPASRSGGRDWASDSRPKLLCRRAALPWRPAAGRGDRRRPRKTRLAPICRAG